MATSVPQPENRGGRATRFARAGHSRHEDHRHRMLVSDTLAALRDGGAKRFGGGHRSMDAARAMLDRLRSR